MYSKRNFLPEIARLFKPEHAVVCLLPFLLAIVFSVSCTTPNEQLRIVFPAAQLDLLKKTTSAIDYGYGYDSKVDLTYIYAHDFSKINRNKKEQDFREVISQTEKDRLIAFYYSIYSIYSETKYKLDYFKTVQLWTNYTYLKNYLLPPLESYFDLLDSAVKNRFSGITKSIEKNKARIDVATIQKFERAEYGSWEIVP